MFQKAYKKILRKKRKNKKVIKIKMSWKVIKIRIFLKNCKKPLKKQWKWKWNISREFENCRKMKKIGIKYYKKL